ncbi:MAG: hypothetical protein LBR64_05685 [Dysgonamonadaceae bacterium]|jgi:hypothetical protein|nr:hypothetical protein [Dysgonamonadaceae bacterium]
MRNDKDAIKILQQSLGNIGGNLHIVETSVPIDKQMEYFNYSEKLRNNDEPRDVQELISILEDPAATMQQLRYALSSLAISGNVEGFRAIEKFNETHKDYWTSMALMQARMMLETELTDERQVFISTGLGGKDDKFRFFVLCKSEGLKSFSEFQRGVIENEFPYFIEKRHCVLERLSVSEKFFTILLLANLEVNIKDLIDEAIVECNQYGDFVSDSYMVTNVKVFSDEEIENELKKNQLINPEKPF